MLTIMVSYDAGSSYGPDISAENVDALQSRMAELDLEGWRWYVKGDDSAVCKRHADILGFLDGLNRGG